MKDKPYPYKNSTYNKSCMFCGQPCSKINGHITKREYAEIDLKDARIRNGIGIDDEEIPHLLGIKMIKV